MLQFAISPAADPTTAEARAHMLENPGFGKLFTDHMVTIQYKADKGWHDAQVRQRAPISLDPAAAVLHYSQEIFEGLKAYRNKAGGISLFRPEANARRFHQSAERLAMAPLPEDAFLEAVRQIVRIDRDWIPTVDGGSLYLRPFMFADEVFLGVKPASSYLFAVIASPAGAYFKSGADGVTVWVSQDYVRAAPGGTGAAKCGGNYAASLLAQSEASRHGCDQVVFLDAVERRWVEELGGMNIFFVLEDKTLITPPLDGTILPGITRDCIIRLARDAGYHVREERYSFETWQAQAASGELREVFACGTAAVVTPIARVRSAAGEFVIGEGNPGKITLELRSALVGIQRGERPDPYGWVQELD